ncbi:MAG: hypothetical protein KAR45_22615, partial [Desulfobacteraceae bacterium]|nr:hypothetical protein [Desulfobacteraceae bacterium]
DMSNTEESELIKSKIKEIDQQTTAADKRLERFKQAVEHRRQNKDKILKEKIMEPLEELDSLIGKGDFPHEIMSIFKDVIGKNRPDLSDLLDELIQPKGAAKLGERVTHPPKKKARNKIRL